MSEREYYLKECMVARQVLKETIAHAAQLQAKLDKALEALETLKRGCDRFGLEYHAKFVSRTLAEINNESKSNGQ